MSEFDLVGIVGLLEKANEQGVQLSLDRGELVIKVEKGRVITDALLDELRGSKTDLKAYFQNGRGAKAVVPTIVAIPRPACIPLSFSQERLWFMDRLLGSVQYHMPYVLELWGDVDVAALEAAFRTIIERHQILRTVIVEEEGQGYQHIGESGQWSMMQLNEEEAVKKSGSFSSYTESVIAQAFDLGSEYPLRVQLIKRTHEHYTLIVVLHHIASDGWSMGLLMEELAQLYTAHTQGRNIELAPLDLQYADYAIWQRNHLQGERFDEQLRYWTDQLQGVEPLALASDYPRPPQQSTRGGRVQVDVDKEIHQQLAQLSQAQGATLFMTLLSAFKILLYRYTGQGDLCVGTPTAGRPYHELEGLIGFFVNTLALRSQLNDGLSFTEFLEDIKKKTLDAYEHQQLPFERIVEALGVERDLSRSPIFQILFSVQNAPSASGGISLPGINMEAVSAEGVTAQYDLNVEISEKPGGGLHISLTYCSDLYRKETMERLLQHYANLLHQLLQHAHQPLHTLQLMNDEEKNLVTKAFNKTKRMYPSSPSVIHLLHAQVQFHPQQVAATFGRPQLSYEELDTRSTLLGNYLQSNGVGPETLVPICLDRSLNMLIGLLGIWKAGGAYVPIDPALPGDRIAYMLEDTGAKLVVGETAVKDLLNLGDDCAFVNLDSDWQMIEAANTGGASLPAASSLAYVLYTSGSTGKPKGVAVEHGALVNFLESMQEHLDFTSRQSIVAVTTFSFDIAGLEFYLPLISGGQVHIASREQASDGWQLAALVRETKPSHLQATPSTWQMLLESGWTNNEGICVLTGGEALSQSLKERLVAISPQVWNLYGPTETTIWSTLARLQSGTTVQIGKPLANTQVFILDAQLQLCPIGVAGELCIAGAGLARGYLNRPDLTEEKFIANPFGPGRLYRTGDLARWKENATLECMGRLDDQVKIRGYRIELGEIETVLSGASGVRQGVVVAAAGVGGAKMLAAYIIKEEGYDKSVVIEQLQRYLPEYMVPQMVVEVDAYPMTANGKINRKALSKRTVEVQSFREYAEAQTTEEQLLVELYRDLLGAQRVGIHDDFFELGGHSLLAMRLASAVRKSCGKDVGVRDIFTHPKIADLATHLQTLAYSNVPVLQSGVRPGRIPLSYSQERLWFVDRLLGSVAYHMPFVFILDGPLDVTALEISLRTIVDRHEALRTVITEYDGGGYQQVMPADDWQLNLFEEDWIASSFGSVETFIEEAVAEPFDLSRDFMLRVQLIAISEEKHVLVAVMHHIASDGWSMGVLGRELAELYTANSDGRPAQLPQLPVQYADYAIWQRTYLTDDVFQNQLDYWKTQLSGAELLELQTDLPRPPEQSVRGRTLHKSFGGEQRRQLLQLAQGAGATLFMTLLAAFKVLLYRYTGQLDISVGTPVAGRQHQEVEGLIGFFVNTLVLRTKMEEGQTFRQLLQEVRTITLEAYEHQQVPFERVVEALGVERDLSRTPLFQIMFALQNVPGGDAFRLKDVSVDAAGSGGISSKYDFSLDATLTDTQLHFGLTFSTDLFLPETMERMFRHYEQLLLSILENPDTAIGSLKMLPEEETDQLLNNISKSYINNNYNTSIVQPFSAQAALHPGATALLFEGQSLSYRELEEKSNRLAHCLKARGVKPGAIVPVCLERGLPLIVSLLAIWKAGGAYLPLDPAYPKDRLAYMLQQANAPAALTQLGCVDLLSKAAGSTRLLPLEALEWENYTPDPLPEPLMPDALAYVIFTSGSTGRPKGVMIGHGSASQFTHWCLEEFKDSSFNVVYATTSVCFDLSVFELFYPLCAGKTVRLLQNGLSIPAALRAEELQPVLINTVPSVVQTLLGSDTAWEKLGVLNMAGEPIPLDVQQALDLKRIEVRNLYGPTEDTTYSTVYRLEKPGRALIGKPIAGTQAYILDAQLQLCPLGVPGELCLAGAGLALGYMNDPGLTAEKFVPNPFGEGKLYRTGDRARWVAGGQLEYLGRRDDQVKVRGYRIELGEIERILEKAPGVKTAAVVASGASASKKLVAFVVRGEGYDKEGLQLHLQSILPEYMVPHVLVEMEALPLNATGKIDRKKLASMEIGSFEKKEYVAPQTQTEILLAGIWQDLLGIEHVGTEDNFFELGGHSMMAFKFMSAINTATGVQIPLRMIFQFPTIARLATPLKILINQSALAEEETQNITI